MLRPVVRSPIRPRIENPLGHTQARVVRKPTLWQRIKAWFRGQ